MANNGGYTRRANSERDIQPVSIDSVDVINRRCAVWTRLKYMIQNVDCAYAVGETWVMPAAGEQWYIERFDQAWRLYGRIPFNDSALLIEPKEGQVSVGSTRGPLELTAGPGHPINAHAPIVLSSYLTADRPSAVDSGPGAMIYDLTLSKPVWSNGTVWKDASGSTV